MMCVATYMRIIVHWVTRISHLLVMLVLGFPGDFLESSSREILRALTSAAADDHNDKMDFNRKKEALLE
jgi:hypothetical protein